MTKVWKTLEFVVRVPVQGEVSMTRMCQDISEVLNKSHPQFFGMSAHRGKFRVASLKRVEAAKKRKRK